MTAIPISTADTAANEKRARTAADIDAVTAARAADAPLTTSQLVTRCRWAVSRNFRNLPAEDAADLTADLVAHVGERHGWTPPLAQVRAGYLKLTAMYLYRDRVDAHLATVSMDDVSEVKSSTRTGGTLLEAERRAGMDYVTPAADPDAADLSAALDVTKAEADAIAAALSGWGSAIVAADAWGCSHDSARKRLQRGRDAMRARFTDAGHMTAAVRAAEALTPDPANPDRADVSPAARAAARAVQTVSGWVAELAPHAAPLPDAWRGHDLPCRIVKHAQAVPAPPQRTAKTPPQRTPGTVPAILRSGKHLDTGTAADVLRYLTRMERVRDALPALTSETPHALRVPAPHVLRTARPAVPVPSDHAAVLRTYRLGCESLRHLVTD